MTQPLPFLRRKEKPAWLWLPQLKVLGIFDCLKVNSTVTIFLSIYLSINMAKTFYFLSFLSHLSDHHGDHLRGKVV